MLFTFKRDDEGRETVHVGDVLVATTRPEDDRAEDFTRVGHVDGVTDTKIAAAIERADEAGFWHYGDYGPGFNHDEVTVDVPIAETTATLTMVAEGDDQS